MINNANANKIPFDNNDLATLNEKWQISKLTNFREICKPQETVNRLPNNNDTIEPTNDKCK